MLNVPNVATPPTAASAVVPASVAPLIPVTGEIATVTVPVKLDGSKSVERIAHSHTDDGCYRCEAHAVPSRDGLRVLFASDWMVAGAGTGSTSITQAFVVDTRP